MSSTARATLRFDAELGALSLLDGTFDSSGW